ncbi:MAG: glycosyltransferase [Candidatus Omnitrophota bacterium]
MFQPRNYKMRISIIIPAHNEEHSIAETISRIENAVKREHEIIVVDDYSTDTTKAISRALQADNINLIVTDNKGKQGFSNALQTGFSFARYELVVPIMADLCDDPHTINKMYSKILDGFDIVCGSRYIKGGKKDGGPFLKGVLSCLAGKSLRILTGIPTSDITNAFKMYRKSTIQSIDMQAKGFEISMEITLKAYFKDFRITEVPTVWRARTMGKSSFKLLKYVFNYLRLYLWAINASIARIFSKLSFLFTSSSNDDG